MPQLFNLFRFVIKCFGNGEFCQSCRNANTKCPRQKLEQGPALVCIHFIKPARNLLRNALSGCQFDHVDNFTQAKRRAFPVGIGP